MLERANAVTQDFVQSTLVGEAVEASEHAVFVSEEFSGVYVAVNQAAARLLGYTRAELLKMRATQISARSAAEVRAIYEELLHTGEIRKTARLRRKDGTVIEIDYFGTKTKVGGIDFLLTVTDPISLARERQ